MLRLARFAVPAVRPCVFHNNTRRSLVSTVLLNRSWENESIASLRKEAKERGLSAKGSKANLILRISTHDEKDIAPPTPTNTRPASSAASESPTTVAPGPGVPPSAATSAPLPPHEIFNIVIPDLSQPEPEPPIDVPYVPFYQGVRTFPKAEPEPVTENIPQMVVVGGVSTYLGDGPTFNLEPVTEEVEGEPAEVETPPSNTVPNVETEKANTGSGLLDDITSELRIPPPKELKQNFFKLFS